jgi:hypothetical protein
VFRLIALDVLDLWDPPNIVVWFLGTGDEQARAPARDASWDSWAPALTSWAADAAEAAAWAADESPRVFWASAEASEAFGAVRSVSLKKYLAWIVKAFDPFAPVGGLL